MIDQIKHIGLLLMAGLTLFGANAQQKTIISQYMFNQLPLNPAVAGSHGQFSATFSYRDQWVNFEGAPQTSIFSVHTGITDTKVGLGLLVSVDEIGIHKDLGVYASYSYHIRFPLGTLYMGLQGGFNKLTSDFTLLNLRTTSDPLLSGFVSNVNPNFGAGAYLVNEKWTAGFSAPFLLSNKIVDAETAFSEAKEARNYYLYLERTFTINDAIRLRPSTLIHLQEGAPFSFDLTATVIIKDLVSFGVSRRNNDAIITLFELKISERLYLGYAYDWTTSDLNQFSSGSHEIMLNYRFKVKGLHKDLLCPAYF
ncbi:MAG: type IX secretion system membrane protein PorP/SprF [Bacteroidetes bacterium]|nr:type IX secretion system membrane protein PorP/SprF [Bacteroidota bacterium]